MKQIIHSKCGILDWEWDSNTDMGFRLYSGFGKWKTYYPMFLRVDGVSPVETYHVYQDTTCPIGQNDNRGRLIYYGQNRDIAEARKCDYDGRIRRAAIGVTKELPEDRFVAREDKEGVIIEPGVDNTDRVLLFAEWISDCYYQTDFGISPKRDNICFLGEKTPQMTYTLLEPEKRSEIVIATITILGQGETLSFRGWNLFYKSYMINSVSCQGTNIIVNNRFD